MWLINLFTGKGRKQADYIQSLLLYFIFFIFVFINCLMKYDDQTGAAI